MIKSSKFIIATFWIAIIAASCNDSDEATPVDGPGSDGVITQEELLTNNVLIGSNSAVDRLRNSGLADPTNFLPSVGRAIASGTTPLEAFSMEIRSRSNSEDCYTMNNDFDVLKGELKVSFDFGDGCEYAGEILQGQFSVTLSYTESAISAQYEYTDFGGKDWLINGNSSMEGTVDLQSGELTLAFNINLTEKWTENADDPETIRTQEFVYVATGTQVMNESGFTIQTQEESATVGQDVYTSKVTSENALFYDYTCENDALVFVDGIENGTYAIGGVTGNWSIDYGDATCDHLITITENGASEEIDLIEELDKLSSQD